MPKDLESKWEELWESVLLRLKGETLIFQKSIEDLERQYIISGSRKCLYTMSVSFQKREATVKLDFNNLTKLENNVYAFNSMYEALKDIEGKFGNSLIWLDGEKIKSIQYVKHFNGFDTPSEKQQLVDFYVNNIVLLEEATRETLKMVKMNLK